MEAPPPPPPPGIPSIQDARNAARAAIAQRTRAVVERLLRTAQERAELSEGRNAPIPGGSRRKRKRRKRTRRR